MFAANLAVWVVLGATPGGDARSMVEQLGSPRYVEREEAAAALERLGRSARPALLDASSSRDPEIRSRAAALLARIDNNLMTKPSLIPLDFEAQPLAQVVRAIGERAEAELVLDVDHNPEWTSRAITLRSAEPLPFWAALDRLCEAGNLQYSPSPQSGPSRRGAGMRLFPGRVPKGPTSDSGPFRITLESVHFQRDLMLSRPPTGVMMPAGVPPGLMPAGPGPVPVQEQFFVQMQLLAEPRLTIAQTHELRLTEAVDDRGQSLIPANAGQVHRMSGFLGMGGSPVVQMPIYLTRPEQPGKVLVKLRGGVPVTVSVRKPDPLVLALDAGSVGKPARGADATLTVESIPPGADNQAATIGLLIQDREEADAAQGGMPARFNQGLHLPNRFQSQIEVIDAQGRIIPSFLAIRSVGEPEGTRLNLSILKTPDLGAPAQLRFYSLTQATTDVSFAFEDVPIP